MLIRVCDNEKCKKQISPSEVKQVVLPHSNTTIDLCPTCYKAFMKEFDKFLKEGFVDKDKVKRDLQIPEPKKLVEKNENSIPSKKKKTTPHKKSALSYKSLS